VIVGVEIATDPAAAVEPEQDRAVVAVAVCVQPNREVTAVGPPDGELGGPVDLRVGAELAGPLTEGPPAALGRLCVCRRRLEFLKSADDRP